jgi:hypothetical protein
LVNACRDEGERIQHLEVYDTQTNTRTCSTNDTSPGCASANLANIPSLELNETAVAVGSDGRIYVVAGLFTSLIRATL